MQVIYEVGRMVLADAKKAGAPALSGANMAGLTVGIAIMYTTALLVAV